MKKLIFFIAFIICSGTAHSQHIPIHPVLQRLGIGDSGLVGYGRTGYVNIAVLNTTTHTMMWFNCFGELFDSARLNPDEYEQVISNTTNPFQLYKNIILEDLYNIGDAERYYRKYGDEILKCGDDNFRLLFSFPEVVNAHGVVQKLIAADIIRKQLDSRLKVFNMEGTAGKSMEMDCSPAPDMSGLMVQKDSVTEYYNNNRNAVTQKIILRKNVHDRLYVYNNKDILADSFNIRSGSDKLLLKEKADVFMLYRAWLEWQWQRADNVINHYTDEQYAFLKTSYEHHVIVPRVNQLLRETIAAQDQQQLTIEKKINNLALNDAATLYKEICWQDRDRTISMLYLGEGFGYAYMHTEVRGAKQYELTDHRGNVMATVSDKKLAVDSNNDGIVDYYKADVITVQDYFPGGMLEPGRTYNNPTANDSSYRYGFNGQQKSTEIDPSGNLDDAEYWEYDSRIGRRWNVEPLSVKYPNLSTYVVLKNNPISGFDPDGKDVIFVNGYRAGPFTDGAYNRDKDFQQKLKNTYWNNVNKGFTNDVENYFNDHTEHFVTGDHWVGSSAAARIDEGRAVGIRMVKSGEINVSKTNNVMTIVMHSQGNAEGIGLAEGIIEQAKKQGITVTVNLVFLSVHQPEGINEKLSAELAKRGIQFTYANDNSTALQPQAKQKGVPDLKGVVDANADNKNWKEDGTDAHSATIDDPGAFNAIKKKDQEKKVFVIKPK